ncbi:terminase small subunit [Bacteriophage Phobos]|uniref:Terminase small subunit n=1 Tax=Bacteriophage Phobos TaxID=2662138 RepID=A0A5Q2U9E0_9CAUD|nr:terminase small subunit [Bacteriophage Phobos]QGH44987.1 terminase small subunit [Bacteriophage Phobos]WPK42383.1 terminase small subunit [Pseudomonas phage Ppu-503]
MTAKETKRRGPGRPPLSPEVKQQRAAQRELDKLQAEMAASSGDDLLDDLLGTAPVQDAPEKVHQDDALGPVSANWLAQVFGFDRMTVKKRLVEGGCPIVMRKKGAPMYNVFDAAAYLVKPKINIAAYVRGLRPQDLPPSLSQAYWDAQLKRQKWEENARNLWRSEDVLEVFGDLSMMLKTTITLWVEEVDRVEGLTPAQRDIITQHSDGLLARIHKLMVEQPRLRTTPSSVDELDDHDGDSQPEGDET